MAKKTVEQIINRAKFEGATAYMIASLINVQLEELGLEQIRPQMMYNYDKNGLINGTRKQGAERNYTLEETEAFVTKFVTMRQNKSHGKAPQTVEQIDEQIAKLQLMKSEMQGTINA